MLREDLITEISMRCDIPMEEVEEVLDEEEMIFLEESAAKKKKRVLCTLSTIVVFIAGVVTALVLLGKKDKIKFICCKCTGDECDE